MLLLNDLTSIHWAIAGLTIGLIAVALQFLANRSLGVSTGFEDLCALGSRAAYFTRASLRDRWRFPFLAGMFCGGVLSAVLGGGWQPTWDAGLLDARLALSPAGKVAWFFGGGVIVGVGTRLAGGCTSGHGIFGLARLQKASFVATLAFMATGVLTANLLWRVLASGGAR